MTKETLEAINPESLLNPILAQMKIIKINFALAIILKLLYRKFPPSLKTTQLLPPRSD